MPARPRPLAHLLTSVFALPLLLAALAPVLTGCVSYAVGSTAETVAPGDRAYANVFELTPPFDLGDSDPFCNGDVDENGACQRYEGGTGYEDLTPAIAFPMASSELRFGLTDRSDVGVRIVGYSGLVASYKHRLRADSGSVANVAFIGGAGVINMGSHAQFEATILVSGRDGIATPYGGVRAMQALRLHNDVPRDRPTFGGFFGLRLGDADAGISPEIGAFHDPSVLGVRKRSLVVIPSITVHGAGLLGRLF